jgi:hypothetical protein
MASVLMVAALAGAVPIMDLPAICRSEQSGVAADQQARVYQNCLHDEQAARDELTKKWSEYPVATRTACVEIGQLVVSYVEVLTCIEIKTRGAAASQKTAPTPVAPPP